MIHDVRQNIQTSSQQQSATVSLDHSMADSYIVVYRTRYSSDTQASGTSIQCHHREETLNAFQSQPGIALPDNSHTNHFRHPLTPELSPNGKIRSISVGLRKSSRHSGPRESCACLTWLRLCLSAGAGISILSAVLPVSIFSSLLHPPWSYCISSYCCLAFTYYKHCFTPPSGISSLLLDC